MYKLGIIQDNCNITICHYLPFISLIFVEEPLPGPRDPMDFDWKLGDAELFTRFFCPIAPSVNCLGDLWLDVTCLQPYLLQCLVIFPLVWDFGVRLFSLFLGPFLDAKSRPS